MNSDGGYVVISSGGMGCRRIPSQKKRPPGGHVVDRLAGKGSQDNPRCHQAPEVPELGTAVDRERAGRAWRCSPSAHLPKLQLRCSSPRSKLMITETPKQPRRRAVQRRCRRGGCLVPRRSLLTKIGLYCIQRLRAVSATRDLNQLVGSESKRNGQA